MQYFCVTQSSISSDSLQAQHVFFENFQGKEQGVNFDGHGLVTFHFYPNKDSQNRMNIFENELKTLGLKVLFSSLKPDVVPVYAHFFLINFNSPHFDYMKEGLITQIEQVIKKKLSCHNNIYYFSLSPRALKSKLLLPRVEELLANPAVQKVKFINTLK